MSNIDKEKRIARCKRRIKRCIGDIAYLAKRAERYQKALTGLRKLED